MTTRKRCKYCFYANGHHGKYCRRPLYRAIEAVRILIRREKDRPELSRALALLEEVSAK